MTKEFQEYGNMYTPQERKELIAINLKALREGNNLSRKEVAEAIGINTQTYATYERGRNEPPIEILLRLAMYHGIPLDELVLRDNRAKDSLTMSKQLDGANQELSELSKALASKEMDAEQKEQLEDMIEKLSGLTDVIKKLTGQ
ncbi:MAG: helix-turn-helix transcriptional regulator [Oscillospiraceae bacterium]|nr:helix-turn-helix transcriptional regulator [Oscillospiraceae bacterium]